jgi:hypothetical protein
VDAQPKGQTVTFDDIRAAHPDLAVSAYALEPGGPVTLEILTPDGASYTFTRPTLAEAVAVAFPPDRPSATPTPAPVARASILD